MLLFITSSTLSSVLPTPVLTPVISVLLDPSFLLGLLSSIILPFLSVNTMPLHFYKPLPACVWPV